MAASNVKNLYILHDDQKNEVFVVAYNMVEAIQAANITPVKAELVATGNYRCDYPHLILN